eukprot:6471973-Amphidinium_carterae.1
MQPVDVAYERPAENQQGVFRVREMIAEASCLLKRITIHKILLSNYKALASLTDQFTKTKIEKFKLRKKQTIGNFIKPDTHCSILS